MTDLPIIFSAPMVRALLDGRKTQTRRLVKPVRGYERHNICRPDLAALAHEVWWHGEFERVGVMQSCPFGQPGDRLWVRESICQSSALLSYAAGGPVSNHIWPWDRPSRPSIHMPRWASRLTLVVTDVRVERLQDISEEDAQAEGLKFLSKDGGRVWKWGIPDRDGWPGTDDDGWPWHMWCVGHRPAFAALWDRLHGADAWARNPWVWALTFTVHRCNIDAMPIGAAPAEAA